MTRTSFVALSMLFVFSSLSSSAQWKWLNPKPSGHTNTNIFFVNSQKGFLFNGNGDLMKTDDQGQRWVLQKKFPSMTTLDLKDSTAVICGYESSIYISQDQGTTWEKKPLGVSDYIYWADVVSRDTIFIANNNKIYRSDDAGQTWHSFTCGSQISSIEFVNSKVGYVGASSTYVLKTEDGGVTWKPVLNVNIIPSRSRAIKFIDENIGFVFREHSTVLKTTDGGLTWKEYNIGDNIFDFYFMNPSTGFACGENGVTYRTDDGGVSWKWIGMTGRIYAYDLLDIYFIDNNIGFTVGTRGRILKTVDGGATWNTYVPFDTDVSDISVPTSTTAYAAVGRNLYKTTDGGQTWNTTFTVPSNNDYSYLQTCHFFSADTGIITISDYARTYKTYDGGQTWKQIATSQYSYKDINCIQFLNKNTGYLVHDNYTAGLISKTTDGGETWHPAWTSQYYGEVFNKIYFTDEKNGFASRYDKLYKTEDSAKTWKELWEDQRITSIWFLDGKTGLIGGENGMLKRTNDSGKTWTDIRINSQYYDDIYTISFFNPQVGYISAEGGTVFKTLDSGVTWNRTDKEGYHSIKSITFAPDSTVWIAGQYGAILRSAVSEYKVDLLYTSNATGCNVTFYGNAHAIMTSVDSIYLQYGIDAFDHQVLITPSVSNTDTNLAVTVSGLSPSSSYKYRLRYMNRGQEYFTEYNWYITSGRPNSPVITASGPTSFCEGDSAILSSSFPYGNQWYRNGQMLSQATGQHYVAKTSGKYQLVTTPDCYPSDTASLSVTVNPVPSTPAITANEETLTSSASAGNQWYLNGQPIEGATANVLKPDTTGQYTVRVSTGDCYSDFSNVYTYVIPIVTPSPFEKQIQIGPNPADKKVNINYSGSDGPLELILLNISGNQLFKAHFNSKFTLNMNRFNPGIYIIKIINKKGEQVSRQIVKL